MQDILTTAMYQLAPTAELPAASRSPKHCACNPTCRSLMQYFLPKPDDLQSIRPAEAHLHLFRCQSGLAKVTGHKLISEDNNKIVM